MKKYDLYWRSNREWWEYDKDFIPVLKETAPVEAKASYQRYLKQIGL